MKKIMSILLVFCLIFSIVISLSFKAQAQNYSEITIGGTISKITYSQTDISEEIKIFSSSAQILNQYVIPPEGDITHYRLCFAISGATVPRTIKFDVNKGSVGQIRLANLSDSQGTNVVIEINKNPDYTLAPSSDGKSLLLVIKDTPAQPGTPASTPKPSASPQPSGSPTSTPKPSATNTPGQNIPTSSKTSNGPLSLSMSGDTCVITLNKIALTEAYKGNTPRFEHRGKEKILQITIPGKSHGFTDGYLSGNSVIYGVLINYNEKQNSTIIRISYENGITYSHSVKNGSSELRIKSDGKTPVSSNTPAPSSPSPTTSYTPAPTPTPSTKPTTTPAPKPSTTPDPKPSTTPVPPAGENVSFTFKSQSITVKAPDITGIKVYRMGNPSRIIMEIPGKASDLDNIMHSSFLYYRVKVAQASSNLARIELFTENMPDWSVSTSSGQMILSLEKNEIINIDGGDPDNNIALRIVSPGIVSRFQKYEHEIVLDDSQANDLIAFMIPVTIANIGNGTATIQDGLTSSIVAYATLKNSFLVLNKVNPDTQYKITAGSNSNELLIVAYTDASQPGQVTNKKLVVLDPGHGGSDPGGTVESYYEKHYNLDIALKCEKILKASGVNVLMTRRSDVFVGLDERAQIANDANASVFISIHNNIMPLKYNGSMTLYYPSSYKGKEYAQIIQNNLVKDLGTGNIGIKADGGLAVLRKTKMPAVIAEIVCMSDNNDMNMLNSEAFRQKAAESLAKSIVQIVNSM